MLHGQAVTGYWLHAEAQAHTAVSAIELPKCALQYKLRISALMQTALNSIALNRCTA
jgi:hypothetical protein